MKQILIIVSILITAVISGHAQADVYTCPMHSEVRSSKPGKCPKCGMTLVKQKTTGKPKPSMDKHHPVHKGKSANDTSQRTNGVESMDMDHSMHDTGLEMSGDMAVDMNMGMNHAYSLNLPMNRNGSGTGWLPDASPMYGYMFHQNKWMYMLHGNLFLRYNSQDITNTGSRGASKFDAPNWLMFMGQKKVGEKDCSISVPCFLSMP